jgi:hypothetical protein
MGVGTLQYLCRYPDAWINSMTFQGTNVTDEQVDVLIVTALQLLHDLLKIAVASSIRAMRRVGSTWAAVA